MGTEVQRGTSLEQVGFVPKRLLGVHPQKQEGLFMQRIKIFGGRISWLQWRKIAELAAKYSPGTPLHLTTRQDIELHNISAGDIALVHEGLVESGISIFAAGGDSIRNITIDTDGELQDGSFDVLPVARLVRNYLEQQPVSLGLGRKFKISFSSSEQGKAKPWINDLGFVAQGDGRFRVLGAGSLGARPALGIELYRDLSGRDVLPLCVAAVEFFADEGDRQNRSKARFRHVRERFGDKGFKAELDRRFRDVREKFVWPEISLREFESDIKLLYRLQLPNGNISSGDALELADIAEAAGVELRINLEHGLELYGQKDFELGEKFKVFSRNPVIVACTGGSTCTRAVTDGWHLADGIRAAVAGLDVSGLRINISSCPNNCAQSTICNIGLVGLIRKENGKRAEHYRVFRGGGNGANNKLGKESEVLSAEAVPDFIKGLL